MNNARRMLQRAQEERVPGVIVIAGLRIACAVTIERGSIEDAIGSFKQALIATVTIDKRRLAESVFIDATTGRNKRITFTHDGNTYRIMADGVKIDPASTRWIITAAQEVE